MFSNAVANTNKSNSKVVVPPKKVKSAISPLRLVIFLTATVIIMLILFFVGFDQIRKIAKTSPLDGEVSLLSKQISSSGEDRVFNQQVIKTLEKVPSERDSSRQYKLFFDASAGIGARYSLSHNPNLRTFLESLDRYVQNNYQDYYKKVDFSVSCTDLECGRQFNPPEILSIRQEIEKTNLGLNKDAMVKTLDNAAFATESEKDRRYAHYVIVLGLLQAEVKNGNKAAQAITLDLENYLKKDFTDIYQQYQDNNKKNVFPR